MEKTRNHALLNLRLKSTSRAAIRAEVFHHWIQENPGTPTLRNTYRYDVEKLSDETLLYLTRPTRLNKGADFVIYCQGFTKFKNGNDKPPGHGDLAAGIEALVAVSKAHETEILTALRRIWDCESSQHVLESLELFKGEPKAERMLLLAKWFFIEQDVTYWTESGRHMLLGYFEGKFGKLP